VDGIPQTMALTGWTAGEPFFDPVVVDHIDQGVPSQPAIDDIVDSNQFGNRETNRDANGEAALNLAQMQVVERVLPFEDPAFPLNSRDVCAFIANKMIGTGIFTAPPTVLLLTRSKGEALGLWILGFAYTMIRFVLQLHPFVPIKTD
jgi:hypothetical protein